MSRVDLKKKTVVLTGDRVIIGTKPRKPLFTRISRA